MMIDIVCAAIAAMASIMVAAIGLGVKRSNDNIKRSNDKADRRAAVRQKESLLSLRMMDATLQLSVVTSNALTGGHNNGNVERARAAAEKVAAEYDEFMRETTAIEVGR